MPFDVPTIPRLIRRIQYDMENALGSGAAFLRFSFENAIARALAAAAYGMHKHVQWGVDQIFPRSSDTEFLDKHAQFWLENGRNEATAAEFDITVTGTGAATIPLTARWTRSDGTEYQPKAAGSLPAVAPFETVITLKAVVAGQAGNVSPSETLTLSSPIANVNAAATVATDPSLVEVGSGTDRESDAAVVVRIEERVQSPPSGGGPGDYVRWAKEVAGVTRAWEVPKYSGGATVGVFFVRDEDADIVPDASEVTAVQDYIDARAPVNSTTFVLAPSTLALTPQIQLKPNNATVQAQVTAQLQDLLLRRAEPGGTLPLSQIGEAISLAANEEDHVLLTPTANVVAASGQLLVLGTPVYSTLT